jgi:hypothetical protein
MRDKVFFLLQNRKAILIMIHIADDVLYYNSILFEKTHIRVGSQIYYEHKYLCKSECWNW